MSEPSDVTPGGPVAGELWRLDKSEPGEIAAGSTFRITSVYGESVGVHWVDLCRPGTWGLLSMLERCSRVDARPPVSVTECDHCAARAARGSGPCTIHAPGAARADATQSAVCGPWVYNIPGVEPGFVCYVCEQRADAHPGYRQPVVATARLASSVSVAWSCEKPGCLYRGRLRLSTERTCDHGVRPAAATPVVAATQARPGIGQPHPVGCQCQQCKKPTWRERSYGGMRGPCSTDGCNEVESWGGVSLCETHIAAAMVFSDGCRLKPVLFPVIPEHQPPRQQSHASERGCLGVWALRSGR